MFFSPGFILIMIVGAIITGIPQMLVKNTFSKFSQVQARKNLTGADVAKGLLNQAGIYDVRVEPVGGELTDHYDPTQKVLRLSESVYHSNSISAFGVAAHEVGHAIQDYNGYIPMKLRSGIVPAVNLGSSLFPILFYASLGLQVALHATGLSTLIALIAIALYGSVVLFQFVTLPVELNASHRALKALSAGGFLESNEVGKAKKVLTAAALTYIAAALFALIQLVYYAWLLLGNRDRN